MTVLDVNQFHGGIDAIREHAVPWIFDSPETYAEQARISLAWRAQRDILHERSRWDAENISAWKLDRLRELVDFAVTHVSLYRSKYTEAGYEVGGLRTWDDWNALPITSRSDIVDAFPDRGTAAPYDLSDCLRLVSSGSTGRPVEVALEPLRAEMDQLYKFRMFEHMAGAALPPDRWVYNIFHANWWVTSQCGSYPTFTISQRAPIAAIIEHLTLLRPSFISGIASAIERLAQQNVDLAALGVLAVSTNSETSAPSARRQWARTLGVPVLDEYSSEEAGLLAYECPQNQMHLVEDDTHVDVVDLDDRGIGEVLTTDLWNRAVPFIRYRQGDQATAPAYLSCVCGVGFRTMGSLEGRRDEAFFSPVAGRISPGVLLELTDTHLGLDGDITEYRVVQTGPTNIELLLVAHGDVDGSADSAVQRFTRALETEFRTALTVDVRRATEISGSNQRKRRVLINQWGKTG